MFVGINNVNPSFIITVFLCTLANKNVNSLHERYSLAHELVSNPAPEWQWPDHQNKPRCPNHVYKLRSM